MWPTSSALLQDTENIGLKCRDWILYFACKIDSSFPQTLQNSRSNLDLSSVRPEYRVENQELRVLVFFLSRSNCVTLKSLKFFRFNKNTECFAQGYLQGLFQL